MRRDTRRKKKLQRYALSIGGFALVCAIFTLGFLVFQKDTDEEINEVSQVAATVDDWSKTITSQTWIVNTERTLPLSYEPEMLVSVSETNVMLVNEAATEFARMVNAMEEPVVPANGYISSAAQQNLYETKREEYRNQGYTEERIEVSMRTEYMPGGKDEHQLGLTVDVCADETLSLDYEFQETEQGQWLLENSWKYGFVFRDQGEVDGIYKPWQLRYVGKVHAQILHELNFSLEEYLSYLEEKEIYYVSAAGESLVIYFRSTLEGIAHSIKEVSGDNAGNYVIVCYQ